MKNKITAFAPASVANLNCGFDILGLAIQEPGDEVTVSINNQKKVRITSIKGDNNRLPYNPAENTAGVSILSLLEELKEKKIFDGGIDIEIVKKMPFGSGLGSSSASAVAGAVAVNTLLNNPLPKEDLLKHAMAGEKAASGQEHADNVAPSLLGGIILIRQYNPLKTLSLPIPPHLTIAIIYPHIEIKTEYARKMLPSAIPMNKMIAHTAHSATFVAALYNNDLTMLSESMKDIIVEPVRSKLIPCFDTIKNIAYNFSDVISFGISGSGPSLFFLFKNKTQIETITEKVQSLFTQNNIQSTLYISHINKEGAKIL